VGVGADHWHAGQRLHDQLLDGRCHVAVARWEGSGSAEAELYSSCGGNETGIKFRTGLLLPSHR
jgi:hypothetical protein